MLGQRASSCHLSPIVPSQIQSPSLLIGCGLHCSPAVIKSCDVILRGRGLARPKFDCKVAAPRTRDHSECAAFGVDKST